MTADPIIIGLLHGFAAWGAIRVMAGLIVRLKDRRPRYEPTGGYGAALNLDGTRRNVSL